MSVDTTAAAQRAPAWAAGRPPVKLSICMPTYNRAKFLDQTLAHLLDKRPIEFPFEIVICDNHSTDDTPAVIAKWASRYPEIRAMRQQSNLGFQRNGVMAHRLAVGELSLYMSDDDRLDFVELANVVRFMDANPNVVAYFGPQDLWDDIKKQSLGYTKLEKGEIYTRKTALDLLNVLIWTHFLPEIGIHRTHVVHRISGLPINVHSAYYHLVHCFDYGDVALMPTPFYRHPLVGDVPEEHAGTDAVATDRDALAGGIEYFAQKAFQFVGAPGVPEHQVAELQNMILKHAQIRLGVAYRVMAISKRYRSAYEFAVRQQANALVTATEVAERRQGLKELAGTEALIEIFEGCRAALDAIGLYGVNPRWLALIRDQRPSLPVEMLQPGSLGGIAHPERILVLAGSEQDRQHLIQAGFQPGFVIGESDLFRLFTI